MLFHGSQSAGGETVPCLAATVSENLIHSGHDCYLTYCGQLRHHLRFALRKMKGTNTKLARLIRPTRFVRVAGLVRGGQIIMLLGAGASSMLVARDTIGWRLESNSSGEL